MIYVIKDGDVEALREAMASAGRGDTVEWHTNGGQHPLPGDYREVTIEVKGKEVKKERFFPEVECKQHVTLNVI